MLSRPRRRLRETAAARATLAEERALQVARCWPTISSRLHLLLVVARQQLAAVRVLGAQVLGRHWMRARSWLRPRVEAAAPMRARSFPPSPAQKWDCQAAAALDRSQCLRQVETSPDSVVQVEAPVLVMERAQAVA
jgi:hypothetical protein